jgi:hypothetical protein
MGKWIAGILATVIGGLLLAYSQNLIFPKHDDSGEGGHAQKKIIDETPPKVVMSALEYGVNRQGNDFDAFGKSAGNEQLCAEMCRTDAKCDAVTYVKSTHICWMKSGVPAATADADMVSAVKEHHVGAM